MKYRTVLGLGLMMALSACGGAANDNTTESPDQSNTLKQTQQQDSSNAELGSSAKQVLQDMEEPLQKALRGVATGETVPTVTTNYADGPGTSACMVSFEIEHMGEKLRQRDCTQASSNIAKDDLKSLCERMAQTPTVEVTYMDRCPPPTIGRCRNNHGPNIDTFYYERPAELIELIPQGCSLLGGTWTES